MTSEPSRRRRGRRALASEPAPASRPGVGPTASHAGSSERGIAPKATMLGLGPVPAPATSRSAVQSQPSGSQPPPLRRRPRRGRDAGDSVLSAPPEPRRLPPSSGGHDYEPIPELQSTPPRRGRLKTVLFGLLWSVLALGVVAAVSLFFVVRHYAHDLPSVQELKAGYHPPQITRIVARDETLLAAEFTERRTVIPFDQVPTFAKNAFLAAEDATFYEHEGINYLGLGRALFANLKAGRTVQGGSTISQQVVKNVLLDSSRSLRRKVREFLLALRLERSLSKDEIFWLYLNHIYLGHGRYGIEEASRYYFGKHASELRLDEAALLAGVIASPEKYSPRRNPEKALARRRYVIGQMLSKGFVVQQVHDDVLKMPLRLAPTTETESKLAPEIVHSAKQVMKAALGDRADQGGYTIYTTIDPELQSAARKAVRSNLDRYMDRHKLVPPYTSRQIKSWGPIFEGRPRKNKVYVGVVEKTDDLSGTIEVRVGDVVGQVALSTESRYNPTALPPSEFASAGAMLRVSLLEDPKPDAKPPLRLELGPQSALVAIDVRSREVLAVVGSYEALVGGLDRATQARRQPGSAFKPIVYSYALHSRLFSPASVLPVQHRGHGVPEEGPLSIDMRSAVAHSNNEAAEFVLQRSGAAQVVQWAKALGIESPLQPDLSLALGSYEVTPFELLGAYLAFARGGTVGDPRFVTQINGADGHQLSLPELPAERQILTPEEAYLTTSLLRSVIESGTARAAGRLNREVAGKTGTTNDSKDAWFVGYSTDIACVVWVGYDDALPLGKGESGAQTALAAWIDFMRAAHAKRPNTRFVRPTSILTINIDPTTGLLAGPGQLDSRMEEFLSGTEPSEIAPSPEPAASAESQLEGKPLDEPTAPSRAEPPPF